MKKYWSTHSICTKCFQTINITCDKPRKRLVTKKYIGSYLLTYLGLPTYLCLPTYLPTHSYLPMSTCLPNGWIRWHLQLGQKND